MGITITHLCIVFLALSVGVWAAVWLYRLITRKIRSRVRRMIVGALLGAIVPSLAGGTSYAFSVATGQLNTLLPTLGLS